MLSCRQPTIVPRCHATGLLFAPGVWLRCHLPLKQIVTLVPLRQSLVILPFMTSKPAHFGRACRSCTIDCSLSLLTRLLWRQWTTTPTLPSSDHFCWVTPTVRISNTLHYQPPYGNNFIAPSQCFTVNMHCDTFGNYWTCTFICSVNHRCSEDFAWGNARHYCPKIWWPFFSRHRLLLHTVSHKKWCP